MPSVQLESCFIGIDVGNGDCYATAMRLGGLFSLVVAASGQAPHLIGGTESSLE